MIERSCAGRVRPRSLTGTVVADVAIGRPWDRLVLSSVVTRAAVMVGRSCDGRSSSSSQVAGLVVELSTSSAGAPYERLVGRSLRS
jgi:hypothetical protein